MSASALLLRLLLCLILILNGSGVAFATTGMELAHVSGAGAHGQHSPDTLRAAMADAGDGQMPCHMPDGDAVPPVEHPGTDDRPAGGDDCCPSSHCACLQHLTATVPQFVVRPAVVGTTAGARPAMRAHPAPPAPHPIRPPIG